MICNDYLAFAGDFGPKNLLGHLPEIHNELSVCLTLVPINTAQGLATMEQWLSVNLSRHHRFNTMKEFSGQTPRTVSWSQVIKW